MINATLSAKRDFRSYFCLLPPAIPSTLPHFPIYTEYISMICNPTMGNVVLQAIFRNGVGITASGKRHYIAVRLFHSVGQISAVVRSRPSLYNSLYERDKTTIPLSATPFPARDPQPPNRRNRCRHRRRKSTMSLIRPVFNVAGKFPWRAVHPKGSSFPPFIDRSTKGNSFCLIENR